MSANSFTCFRYVCLSVARLHGVPTVQAATFFARLHGVPTVQAATAQATPARTNSNDCVALESSHRHSLPGGLCSAAS
eukprot:4720020-Alexandrium_andersonii.AAC.1